MRPTRIFLAALLMVVATFSSAWSQTGEKVGPHGPGSDKLTATSDAAETNGVRIKNMEPSEEPTVWIHLVDGRRLQVDELTERSDGVWYKRGNVTSFLDREKVDRVERITPTKPNTVTDPLRGSGAWKISDSARVERFFMDKFGRSLPVGAFGQSYLHTRWGLDHRNGLDVSLHPDSPAGRTLINFLRTEGIPFLAFRGPIPGVATGPHIHVGNPSPRFSGRK